MHDEEESDEELLSFWHKFHKKKEGTIILTAGSPEQIHVKTHFTPKRVELSFSDECSSIPVCLGGHDWFDVKIVHNGFILLVKLTSNERQIEWKATK